MGYHRAKGSYKEILKEGIGGYPFGVPDYVYDGVTSYLYKTEVRIIFL